MKKKKKSGLQKRPLIVFAGICLLFCCLLLRLYALQTGEQAVAGAQAGKRYVELARTRGYIYDRNLQPLVNEKTSLRTAAIINDETAALLREAGGPGISGAKGTVAVFESNRALPQSAVCVQVAARQRYSENQLCAHLIGYLDADGRGVCGIERSFDRILTDAAGEFGVTYTVNGLGAALAGSGLEATDRQYDSPAGVVLTIDRDLQRIAEAALRGAGIGRGAAVILDVSDGAILACASVPAYDPTNVAASLEDPALPFLNRALEAYPVGSVFKPFVAVAAVENGVSVNADFTCGGRLSVGDVPFGCYQRRAHGAEGLNEAICNSCNTYFIDLGRRTGADTLLEVAARFGFGAAVRLTGDLGSVSGRLPTPDALSAPAALANFSFGQGELLASPLQLAAAYAALAGDGVYRTPYLMKALVDDRKEVYAEYRNESDARAAEAGVCGVVNEALRLNMTQGTGVRGCPESVTSAGKTATAQTGAYDENGVERLCTWFCGFFPFESPCCAVVVFNENGSTAAQDCAPVFQEIADAWASLNAPD